MITTSIIIPLRNGHTSLETCLAAVRKNRSAGGNLEVVVVGAGLRSEPDLAVAQGPFPLRLVPLTTAETFARECNVGAGVASGECLVFLDPVTTAQAGWLDALLDHAAAHPAAAVIGSKLVGADGTVRHAGIVFGQDRYPRPLYAGFPMDHPAVNKSRRFQAVSLDGALIRRRDFDLLGGFDTDFAGGLADVDLCLRMAEYRHEAHYCHRSVLFQPHRPSRWWCAPTEDDAGPYRRRWAHRVAADDLHYLIEDGLLTVRYGPDHGLEVEVSPILRPNGDVPQDQAGDRPPAVSSKALIELMTRAFDLSRQIQGLEGRWMDRFNELSTRVEQQISRPSPERDAQAANHEHPRGQAPAAQLREGAGVGPSVQSHPASNGVHVATGPTPPAAPRAVDAPERVNGFRPKKNSYAQVRQRIREVVNAELPTGSVVVVVSRGDDNLLRLGPRRGWHFPQGEAGVYAGCYPADSAEAIAQLEAIRRKGGDYLLFPSTAFWWLGYYGDFQKYLESHYPCICSDPACLIFQLSTTPGGGP
jgi:GT2 family glycosyltransferase